MAISLMGLILAEPTLDSQLMLVFIWGVSWFLVIRTATKCVFEPYVLSRPWCDQWTDLSKRTFKSAFMIDFKTRKEAFQFGCEFLVITCQHGIGGLLCIPSVVGMSGPFVTTLACHGALCEAGWELQDVCQRLYQVLLGGQAGKEKNPTAFLVVVLIHHAMGLSMVVPMNLYYSDFPYYHELVMLLQGAAFVALLSQNYGFTLNCKQFTGLMQMKFCVSITLVTLLWSRVFRFFFVGYKLLSMFQSDGCYCMLYGGAVVICLASMFNVLVVLDAIKKFLKFVKMAPCETNHQQSKHLAGAPSDTNHLDILMPKKKEA